MDRAPLLGSCCLIGQCNNQLNDDVSGGRGVEEEIRLGATRGGGRLLVVLGGELSDKIKKERGRRSLKFQWLPLIRETQQPTKNQPNRWDTVGEDGTQGDDDGGVSYRIFLTIELGRKK